MAIVIITVLNAVFTVFFAQLLVYMLVQLLVTIAIVLCNVMHIWYLVVQHHVCFVQLLESQIADSGVVSSIPIRPHPMHSWRLIIKYFTVFPPSTDSRRAVVSYKRKYVHFLLVNRLV